MAEEINRPVHLHPFVPGEKAKWHQRVTHKHPVVSLLQHIEDRPQDSDGGQSAQGRAVPNKVYDLSFNDDYKQLHLKAHQVARVQPVPNGQEEQRFNF